MFEYSGKEEAYAQSLPFSFHFIIKIILKMENLILDQVLEVNFIKKNCIINYASWRNDYFNKIV